MTQGRWIAALALAVGVGMLTLAAHGGNAAGAKNTYIGSNTCLTCHHEYARQWAQLDHSKALLRPGRAPENAGCEACHGPGGRHATRREARAEIRSWTPLSPAQQSEACLRCHQPRVTAAGWKSSPHAGLGVSCLFCHEVHRPTGHAKNLKQAQAEQCGGCHAEVAEQAAAGKHHALPEGVSCTACHDPHSGAREHLLRADPQVLCRKCHAPDGARVRPASHQADGWFQQHGKKAKGDTSRCQTCHNPPQFCTPCHGTEMPHPEGFVMQHGAQALEKPDTCARCHDQKKCGVCHQHLAPKSHRQEQFRAQVAETAKGKEALCRLCHVVPVPHPQNWVMEHKSQGARFDEGSPCFQCHQKADTCARCHPGQS